VGSQNVSQGSPSCDEISFAEYPEKVGFRGDYRHGKASSADGFFATMEQAVASLQDGVRGDAR
jgi:hypothetical protein